MSRLVLDTRRLDLLGRALDVLASPLDFDGVDAWRGAANRAVKELFDGDRVIFSLPDSGSALMYSDEYDPSVFDRYVAEYRDMDVGRRRLIEDRYDVFSKERIYARGFSPTESRTYAAYHDAFLAPLKIRNSFGMIAEARPDGLVALWIHNERPAANGAGEEELQLFQLLLPAFRAGVSAWRRFARFRDRLGAMFDDLREPVALVDLAGKSSHYNRALRRLLDSNPNADRIQAHMARLAHTVAAPPADPGAGAGRPAQRITAGGRAYQLLATPVDRALGLDPAVVMVAISPAADPPSIHEVRNRFGLTRREAAVAQLLWRRKSNLEIAETLVISPHTARHHTEKVLAKLGIHSRRDVPRVLDEGEEP